MVRFEGTVVNPLAGILIGDWILETGEPLQELIDAAGLGKAQPLGTANVQVVPSGPGESEDGLLQMILGLINSAQHELVLTTPYLVPDDPMILALRGAAGRGVQVTLIVPEKVNSFLTRYASRSYYDDLLDAGVAIQLYRGGLLHTKSISVDGTMSMFGTVNLDMRSLWLNYEVALFIYQREFADALRALQKSYVESVEAARSVGLGYTPFQGTLDRKYATSIQSTAVMTRALAQADTGMHIESGPAQRVAHTGPGHSVCEEGGWQRSGVCNRMHFIAGLAV